MSVTLRDARERDEDRRWFAEAYAAWLREFGGDAVAIAAQAFASGTALATGRTAGRAGDAVDALARAEARQRLAAADTDVILVLRDASPVGFALVQRTRSVAPAPALHTVAEFYLVPERRRSGVGAAAAALIFDRFGGEWEVATLQRHPHAVRFWRETVRRYTGGRHRETVAAGEVRQRFFARPPRVPGAAAAGARPGESNGAR